MLFGGSELVNPKDLTRGEMAFILGAICGQIEAKRENGTTFYGRPTADSIMRKFIAACPSFETAEPFASLDRDEQGEAYWEALGIV